VKETTEAIDPDNLSGIRFAPQLNVWNWRSLAEALVWASHSAGRQEDGQPSRAGLQAWFGMIPGRRSPPLELPKSS
jgi:hypothetical protein